MRAIDVLGAPFLPLGYDGCFGHDRCAFEGDGRVLWWHRTKHVKRHFSGQGGSAEGGVPSSALLSRSLPLEELEVEGTGEGGTEVEGDCGT